MTTTYKILGKEVARYQYMLADCALSLNSHCYGTSDLMPAEEALTYMLFLCYRINDWKETPSSMPKKKEVDDAVRNLCAAAVAYYVDYQMGRDVMALIKYKTEILQQQCEEACTSAGVELK